LGTRVPAWRSPPDLLHRKISLLMVRFGTRSSKDWFEDEFRGLARLRGVESRAPGGFAEAFFRAQVLAWLNCHSAWARLTVGHRSPMSIPGLTYAVLATAYALPRRHAGVNLAYRRSLPNSLDAGRIARMPRRDIFVASTMGTVTKRVRLP
jgi:hypothetical protein